MGGFDSRHRLYAGVAQRLSRGLPIPRFGFDSRHPLHGGCRRRLAFIKNGRGASPGRLHGRAIGQGIGSYHREGHTRPKTSLGEGLIPCPQLFCGRSPFGGAPAFQAGHGGFESRRPLQGHEGCPFTLPERDKPALICGRNSCGRVLASQAGRRGFESRRPLYRPDLTSLTLSEPFGPSMVPSVTGRFFWRTRSARDSMSCQIYRKFMATSPSGKGTVCKTVIRGFDPHRRLHGPIAQRTRQLPSKEPIGGSNPSGTATSGCDTHHPDAPETP